jgi:polar amino acid transport system permease protein
MEALIQNFFNVDILLESLPYLLHGLAVTALLCAVAVPLGLAGGLGLALLSSVRHRGVKWATILYTDFFRAFPPLVLLMFIAFALPFLGVDLPVLGAVSLAFFLNASSYYGEILRAGIDSVPPGQTEAARSSGLSQVQALVHVVVPQAVKNVMPDLISNTLEVVKLTSIASVVALPELLYAARQAQSLTYNATPVVAAGALYLALLWPMVRVLTRFERKAVGMR